MNSFTLGNSWLIMARGVSFPRGICPLVKRKDSLEAGSPREERRERDHLKQGVLLLTPVTKVVPDSTHIGRIY